MKGLQKPPDVMTGIGDVLNGEWIKYISRLEYKVILLLTHVLLAYTQFTV